MGFFLSFSFAYFSLFVVLPVATPPGGHDDSDATTAHFTPKYVCRCFHPFLRLFSVLPYFPSSFSSFSLATTAVYKLYNV